MYSFKPRYFSNLSNLTSSFSLQNFTRLKFLTLNKLILTIFILVLGFGIFYWISSIVQAIFQPKTTEKTQIAPPISTQNINKEFNFSLKDQKGAEVSKLKFVVERVELRDEVIVKGQRATLPANRIFLIINLKITNDFNKSVQINTRDYIRLIINNNEKELLAPEVHNDPVEVQATSTKYTRLGFAINAADKDLKLRIGEVDQDKTTINLNLK